jgi:hypothetical protein
MPLTVDDFLATDPELASLRRSLEYSAPESRERRRLLELLAAREVQARERWQSGLEGWMTVDEAAAVVTDLQAEAARLERVAQVEVRDDRIVFSGARSEHSLALSATSPVRARAHWLGYLESCPMASAPAPTPEPAEPAEPAAEQLDLGDLLGVPEGRRPRERSRMLSVPLPARDRRDGR